MAIRMIATDMDGTLLDRDRQISVRTILALKGAMESGALVVLSSGRMLDSITPFAEKIGVNAPVICFNGALTYDVGEGRACAETLMDQATARAVCREMEQMGQYVQGCWGSKFYYAKYAEETRGYEEKCGVRGQEAGMPLSEFIACGVYKLLMIVRPGDIPKYLPRLRAKFSDKVDFTPSSESFLECVALGVNKGASLRQLGASRGIAPSEILAFGDEQNDLAMLTQVGYGYAMANADEVIRRQVRFVAPSNAEDGVAQVVERYLSEGIFESPREVAKL